MNTIIERLKTEFDKVAVCHCGNGVAGGCCDNHAPSWNPCHDSQLLYDARRSIEVLLNACRCARNQFVAERDGGRMLRRDTVIDEIEKAMKFVEVSNG